MNFRTNFFIHKGEEIGYVLPGKLMMKIGNTSYPLRDGDVIYLTTEMPSHWQNPGPGLARLFWLKL